jgi:hypothetical protein
VWEEPTSSNIPKRDEFGDPINPNTGRAISVRTFNQYVKSGKISEFNMIPRIGEDAEGNLKNPGRSRKGKGKAKE